MSLLDQASLIVTPNGYKASKLYSVKPTDASGDMVVSRATTATRVNSAGLIESVAINVPRLDYTLGSCPSILVEPQRTNLLLRSEEFDNASWSKTGVTVTANYTTAPDGTTTADLITPTISDAKINQGFNPTGALQHNFSVYLRSDTGSSFSTILRITRDSPFSSVASTTITVTTEWQRFYLPFTALDTTTHQATIGSNSTLQTGEIFYAWGAQCELGSNATSYIPTTTATVTRNADVISKTGVSSLIGQTEGTIFIEADLTANTDERRIITISNGTETQRIMFWTLATTLYANFNGVGISLGSFPIGTAKIALGYTIAGGSTTYSIKVNNNTLITGTAAAAPNPLTNINLGSSSGGFGLLNDRINLVTLFTTRLTNTQLGNLTAI